jgi:DNA polymerase-3 subunit epsilon
VVEIAWIEIDANLNVLDEVSSLIDPGRPIDEGASNVHGIYDADVFAKPTLERFYKNNWDNSPTVVIAHNKVFDLKFIAEHINHLSGSLCTLAAARQYIPEAPNHKLVTLAEFLKLPKGTAHRASGDVYTTLGLLRYIRERSGRTLPDLVKLDCKPKLLAEMPFGMYKGHKFLDMPPGYLTWLVETEDMPGDVKLSAQHALNLK